MESMGLPFYYFENTEGGHGAGVTNEQRAKSIALTYAYLWQQLGGGPRMCIGEGFAWNPTVLGAKSIAIKLTAVSGSALVDDLYIDPFLAR